jgi:hypothetical protein
MLADGRVGEARPTVVEDLVRERLPNYFASAALQVSRRKVIDIAHSLPFMLIPAHPADPT